MMRLRLSFELILLVLALGLSSASHAENQKELQNPTPSNRVSGKPEQKHSAQPNNNPQQDERGTENNPLVIKGIPTTKDPHEAQEDRRDKDIKTSLDQQLNIFTGWQAAFAGLMFLATAAQVFLFWWQLTIMRDALDASRLSAEAAKSANEIARDTLILSNRPYIQVTFSCPGLKINPVMNRPDSISLKIMNIGKSPAMISAIKFGSIIHPAAEPWPLTQTYLELPLLEDYLPQGDVKRIDRPIIIKDHEFSAVKDGRMALLIFGYVDYMDSLQNRYRLGYGWYYDHRDDPNLRNIANKAYNYDRKCNPNEGNDWVGEHSLRPSGV